MRSSKARSIEKVGPVRSIAVHGKFDSSQPFRIHVEGCVCSIVSGAALLTNEPDVEYGGQFVDWNLADDPDFQKRSAFWREYEKARSLRAPLDVFRFLQHDHVMRRPVKLLARHTRAVFEARPLAIRLGPIVRYVDSRRALVWLELETPGLVRVTYGKATNQRELPKTGEVPTTQSQSHTTSVRVGGRHYALVWLDALDADAAYQYTIALAPLPPTGPLPIAQADFTETVFPRTQTFWSRSNTNSVLKTASFSNSEWIFFRTAPLRADALRFAHGSCRKWPGDHGPKNPVPGPDMLEAFSAHLLAKKNWADWPQFFLHSGDQIYADDVGAAMSRAILRHRFASVLPGPGPVGADDVAFGAWAGRFGWRYSPRATGPAKPSPDDVDPKYLRSFFDYRGYDRSLVDGVIDTAIAARRFAAGARSMADATRPLRHKLRVMNELLWRVPVSDRDIPIVDKVRGLRTRAVYRHQAPQPRLPARVPICRRRRWHRRPRRRLRRIRRAVRAGVEPARDATPARPSALVHDLRRPRGHRRLERRPGLAEDRAFEGGPASVLADDDDRCAVRVLGLPGMGQSRAGAVGVRPAGPNARTLPQGRSRCAARAAAASSFSRRRAAHGVRQRHIE